MADKTDYDPRYETKSERISDIKGIFESKTLETYRIIKIEDVAPVIKEKMF